MRPKVEIGVKREGVEDGFELESRSQIIPTESIDLRLCVCICNLIDNKYIGLGSIC